jgi:hypothetical protein
MFVVCNSRYTAGSMIMAPGADEGMVDVIVADKMGRWQLLCAFPRIRGAAPIVAVRRRLACLAKI